MSNQVDDIAPGVVMRSANAAEEQGMIRPSVLVISSAVAVVVVTALVIGIAVAIRGAWQRRPGGTRTRGHGRRRCHQYPAAAKRISRIRGVVLDPGADAGR